MKVQQSYSFKFQAQELPQKLSQLSQDSLTGYWLFEFPSLSGTDSLNSWYLGLSQGQVVFSGNQQICWQVLLKIFQRYVPRLQIQNADARQAILALEQRFIQEKHKGQLALVLELLHELQQLNLLTIKQLREALRLKILSDFDVYLFNYPGQAKFLPFSQLELQTPLLGFDIEVLLSQAKTRQASWHQLQATIPSMESVPVLNHEVVKSANLTSQQNLWLETLTSSGKNLNEIASYLAQDSLEIANIFASLISKRLVKIKSSVDSAEIFVVDDSLLILKQFESLVKSWGYSVRSFHNPTTVLQAITHANPAAFFLDINMPGITGFDLVKQIRRQPQLASVPIVMLTAEQTLTNNWRARWSGCQFLSKPLTPNDVPKFKKELRVLLAELLLLHQPSQVETHLGYQT